MFGSAAASPIQQLQIEDHLSSPSNECPGFSSCLFSITAPINPESAIERHPSHDQLRSLQVLEWKGPRHNLKPDCNHCCTSTTARLTGTLALFSSLFFLPHHFHSTISAQELSLFWLVPL
jgi:hypothetical protein